MSGSSAPSPPRGPKKAPHPGWSCLPSRLGRLGVVCGVLGVLGACDRGGTAQEGAPAARIAPAAATAEPRHPWHDFEQRRDTSAVLEALARPLPAPDRIAAARALARIADPKGRARLRQLLFDDDLEVVTWAAFGVGQDCEPVAAVVKDLLARSASIFALAPSSAGRRDALRTLASALGRCGSEPAESALRGWLGQGGELADHGAYGLGHLATRHGHLTDKTQVALLAAVTEGQSAAALFPFTRLTRLSEAVQARLLEVAGQALTQDPGTLRSFAVRALPQAGSAAVAPLGQVLRNAAFRPEERAAAAQGLARLGSAGQEELAAALAELPLPNLAPLERLGDDAPGTQGPSLDETTRADAERALAASSIWFAALAHLQRPGAAQKRLVELAHLEVPSRENVLGRRRAIALRCRAADLLAGPNPGDPRLHACDPDSGSAGALATLRALDRAPLTGVRLATWKKLVADANPVVRQAALRLLASHAEVEESAEILRQALESDQLGTVVTALQLLAAYPARGARPGAPDVDRELGLAIEAILQRKEWSHAIEALSGALDAAGALGVLSLKGAVEAHCQSPHVELREHAARALGLLGDPKRTCQEVTPWAHPTTPPSGPVRLTIDSAVGPLVLHLDGELAPAAVGRVTELARSGYYDGLPVHRVVEGFVAQFGDRPGDGFGEPDRPPLPCERSPVPFESLDVGMALAGRDTATTQWFVALERYPQLDGAYTRIGRAEGAWHLLGEGDRMRSVRVSTP